MLALFIVDGLFDSFFLDGLVSLVVASLVLVLINLSIKPLLMLLSLPFIALTLGLAIPLINGLMLLLVAELVDGFHVSGYWMAVLCALVFSVVSMLIALATGQSRVLLRQSGGFDRSDRPHRPRQRPDEPMRPRRPRPSTHRPGGRSRSDPAGEGPSSRPRAADDDDVIEVEVREKKDSERD